MLNSSLTEISAALAAGNISSVELTRVFLDRIAELNGDLNAFIWPEKTRDVALAQARAADDRRAGGDAGPLTGIPIAFKDIYCTKGVHTTCGSRMLENFVSPYDAHVVEQFGRAGAVMLGKCNMDQFAMGSSNESSYFGPVRNSWARNGVPGGSSGGSSSIGGISIGGSSMGGSSMGGSSMGGSSTSSTVIVTAAGKLSWPDPDAAHSAPSQGTLFGTSPGA